MGLESRCLYHSGSLWNPINVFAFMTLSECPKHLNFLQQAPTFPKQCPITNLYPHLLKLVGGEVGHCGCQVEMLGSLIIANFQTPDICDCVQGIQAPWCFASGPFLSLTVYFYHQKLCTLFKTDINLWWLIGCSWVSSQHHYVGKLVI